MKMNNGDTFDLIVDQDEAITVIVVRSIGLVDLVNYSLNGTAFPGTKPKSDPCSFQVHRSSVLSMTLHYADNEGGSFSIQVTGDHGGDVSVASDSQATGEAFTTVSYTFTIK
jgi:hypothetical protein